VVPYQCLEYIWFQGDKSAKGHVAPTVRAVVTHFNYVVNCVIQTCVGDENLDASDRAMVVENWIEVAWVCSRRGPGQPLLLSLLSRYGLWSDSLHRCQVRPSQGDSDWKVRVHGHSAEYLLSLWPGGELTSWSAYSLVPCMTLEFPTICLSPRA
jgi:hypothetical protein